MEWVTVSTNGRPPLRWDTGGKRGDVVYFEPFQNEQCMRVLVWNTHSWMVIQRLFQTWRNIHVDTWWFDIQGNAFHQTSRYLATLSVNIVTLLDHSLHEVLAQKSDMRWCRINNISFGRCLSCTGKDLWQIIDAWDELIQYSADVRQALKHAFARGVDILVAEYANCLPSTLTIDDIRP